jgi:hypothetical protein
MAEFDFLVTGCNIVLKGKTIERWRRKTTGLSAFQRYMAAGYRLKAVIL